MRAALSRASSRAATAEPLARLLQAAVALAALATGFALASRHPLAPGFVSLAFAVCCLAAARWRDAWLWALPAALPLLNFAPWTGWTVFDEFDLLVLAAVAGGHARLAWRAPRAPSSLPTRASSQSRRLLPAGRTLPALPTLIALLFAAGLIALARGGSACGVAVDAPLCTDPWNGLHVFKNTLAAALLLPLLLGAMERSADASLQRFAHGMLLGIVVVVAAVLWERAAYPGLWDFSEPYRTVALFWEMRVGGAAIDFYLALALPFVAWAVASAQTPARWLVAAALAVLFDYACLTTFSRGVYLAAFGGLATLALLASRRPTPSAHWRRRANLALALVLLIETLAIVGAGSFIAARTERAATDFGHRLEHWQGGVALLQTPLQWLFGRGLGRFPDDYAAEQQEFSGELRLAGAAGDRYITLSGPPQRVELSGLYAATQRVPLQALARYRVALDVRADRPAALALSVCEMHLLYERACQRGVVRIAAGGWQHRALTLRGPLLDAGSRWAPRQAVFSAAMLGTGTSVDIDRITLHAGTDANLLQNADFSRGLAHWLPAARSYFVPWHIDNLWLEVLIEQGLLGVAAFALLYAAALARVLAPSRSTRPMAPCLATALIGALLVGLVSSVFDMPRVAFLLLLIAMLAIERGERDERDERGEPA
jgi:hypothetical protein